MDVIYILVVNIEKIDVFSLHAPARSSKITNVPKDFSLILLGIITNTLVSKKKFFLVGGNSIV
jgi:hypothetical protein